MCIKILLDIPYLKMYSCGICCVQLSEVRREVELSRRRSIRLKAQVDKLQEKRDGPGWSQHRERVNVTHSVTAVHSVLLENSARLSLFLYVFISVTGHRGGSVRSAAPVPADRARVQPT